MITESQKYAQMNQSFINQMNPYVEEMEVLINVGFEDLEKYKVLVEEIKKEAINDPSIDQNILALLDIKVNKFNKKLMNQKKNLIIVQMHYYLMQR